MTPGETIAKACLNAYNRAGCGPTGIDAAIGAVDVELKRLGLVCTSVENPFRAVQPAPKTKAKRGRR